MYRFIYCFFLSFLFFGNTIMGQNIGIGHNVAEGMLDLNGDLVLRSGNLILSNGISLAVDVETYPFSNYRITGPNAAFSIGGISASPDGKQLSLFNQSGQQMTIMHENVAAELPDRILTGTGNSIVIPPNASISFTYEGNAQRWVVTSHSAPLPSSGQGSWVTSENRMYNTNAGNVGIGTQFPQYKLSVLGNGYFYGNTNTLLFQPGQQGGEYISPGALQLASPNLENYPAGIENNVVVITGNQMQSYVRDVNDGTASDYVRSFSINPLGGNIGIGTANPAHGVITTIETPAFSTALLLRNPSNSVKFEAFLGGPANGNTVSLGTPGAMPIAFFTNSANRMVIAANGNIGIGTELPDGKLQVNGKTKLNGNLHLPIRIINSAGIFNVNEGDLNIVVDVPNSFQGVVRIELPDASTNAGRILNISAFTLPVKSIEDNLLVNKQAIVVIRPCFDNCLPTLHRSDSDYTTNDLRKVVETTSILIQSDGITWRLISKSGTEFSDHY